MTGERKWEVGSSQRQRHHWFLWRSGDTKVEFRTGRGADHEPEAQGHHRTKREAQQVAQG